MYRPRVLINVFLVNSTEDLILAVKKYTNSCWELVGEKLKFGEQFDECVKRVLKEETSIIINDNTSHDQNAIMKAATKQTNAATRQRKAIVL